MRSLPRRLIAFAVAVISASLILRARMQPPTAVDEPRRAAEAAQLLRSGAESPYVHRLTLYDHDGQAINPDDEPARPYSPITTCGKCHEVGRVMHGWHFNAGLEQGGTGVSPVRPGRPGEPWILTAPALGTQIPLSARAWPGTFTPEQLGLSPWDFILEFGRHMPGGGLGDPSLGLPDREGEAPAEPSARDRTSSVDRAAAQAARWNVSGALQIDCLFCHSADQTHDPAEAARQIERQNFRWAPTAALGLAVIRGEARKLPDDWDPAVPPSPDRPEQSLTVVYDRARFDPDGRVFFNLTRRPEAARCLFCHSTRTVGAAAPLRWQTQTDVHLASGMVCTDCHRNDIGHAIVRGYESEGWSDPPRKALTCQGCHLGAADVWGREERAAYEESRRRVRWGEGGVTVALINTRGINTEESLGGQYGAPHPQHRGIPTLHFDRLTCTACHSGPWPEEFAQRVQTSMAHALGLPSKERRDDDLPLIVEPIFARDAEDRIAPHRLLWPAFFGVLRGDRIEPLPLSLLRSALGKAGSRAKRKTDEPARPLTPDDVTMLLTQLAARVPEGGQPVYVHDHRVTRRTAGGSTETIDHAAARPYLWPLAHDVRPAAQSLGVRGCTDCHETEAPLFFGHVAPAAQTATAGPPAPAGQTAPAEQPAPPIELMYQLQDADPRLARGWAALVAARTPFACVSWLSVAALCAGLFVGAARWAVSGGATGVAMPAATRGRSAIEVALLGVVMLGVAVLAVTGFVGWLALGHMRGWLLFAHMLATPLFVVGLPIATLLALCGQGAGEARWSRVRNMAGSLTLVLGLLTTVTILAAMTPLFGYALQERLYAGHRASSIGLIVAALVYTLAPRSSGSK